MKKETGFPESLDFGILAKDEPELIRRLDEGYSLVQSLNEDKFLFQKP